MGKPGVNVVTIVAWAGVGKSTLVNHWLRRMASDRYRSAELFLVGPSTDRAAVGGLRSQMNFLMRLYLVWRSRSTARNGLGKGRKIGQTYRQSSYLIGSRRLEPLQNPPGSQEGRIREPALQALMRELAAFNTGLCVVTTRLPVADLADHERTSTLRLTSNNYQATPALSCCERWALRV